MNNLNTLLKKLSVIQMHFETLSKANETFNIFNEYPFGYLIFQNQDIRATPLKINCYHYSTKIPQLRCLIPDIKGR